MEQPTQISDALTAESNIELASWNRPRSSEELRAFVASRAVRFSMDSDVE